MKFENHFYGKPRSAHYRPSNEHVGVHFNAIPPSHAVSIAQIRHGESQTGSLPQRRNAGPAKPFLSISRLYFLRPQQLTKTTAQTGPLRMLQFN